MLWLHAYKYTIPGAVGGDESDSELAIKTSKPEWAKESYKFIPWKKEEAKVNKYDR